MRLRALRKSFQSSTCGIPNSAAFMPIGAARRSGRCRFEEIARRTGASARCQRTAISVETADTGCSTSGVAGRRQLLSWGDEENRHRAQPARRAGTGTDSRRHSAPRFRAASPRKSASRGSPPGWPTTDSTAPSRWFSSPVRGKIGPAPATGGCQESRSQSAVDTVSASRPLGRRHKAGGDPGPYIRAQVAGSDGKALIGRCAIEQSTVSSITPIKAIPAARYLPSRCGVDRCRHRRAASRRAPV